jgi:hypothetical protein
MSDDRLDPVPRHEFADRLEEVLVGRLEGSAGSSQPSHLELEHHVELKDDPNPPTRRWTRWYIAAAVAAAVAVIGVVALVSRPLRAAVTPGSTATTLASAPTTTVKGDSVPVTFTVTWSYDKGDDCPSPMCLTHFKVGATSTLKGDIEGSAWQAIFWNGLDAYGATIRSHLEHVAVYAVDGKVNGCDTGSFMLTEIMQFTSDDKGTIDKGHYDGTWQIVPQSGRGGLVNLSGSGVSHGLYATAGDVGRTFTGTLSCRIGPGPSTPWATTP